MSSDEAKKLSHAATADAGPVITQKSLNEDVLRMISKPGDEDMSIRPT